ncbi:hypothetical protein B0H14DRAFT_2669704 [Mycena olivaceomarginata]|nr:hypothetical protein B0H14DRAFT_2669704 [Mycena olivaceomarginata]
MARPPHLRPKASGSMPPQHHLLPLLLFQTLRTASTRWMKLWITNRPPQCHLSGTRNLFLLSPTLGYRHHKMRWKLGRRSGITIIILLGSMPKKLTWCNKTREKSPKESCRLDWEACKQAQLDGRSCSALHSGMLRACKDTIGPACVPHSSQFLRLSPEAAERRGNEGTLTHTE